MDTELFGGILKVSFLLIFGRWDREPHQKIVDNKQIDFLNTWFPLALENLENWEKFFQSGKSQRILKLYQKVRVFWSS